MREALEIRKLRKVYNRAADRYDKQHSFFTAGSDQRGRELVVELAVSEGDNVLDAGAGTGSTAILAAKKTGPSGSVVLYDMSDKMLMVARKRLEDAGLIRWAKFANGDITDMPYPDNSFDVVLSTYSTCPLYDPVKGVLEMYRVLKPGGKLGIAHTTEPNVAWLRWLARRVEAVAWQFPAISLGCRPISVLPALINAGAKLLFRKKVGVPLWPFLVFIVEKP